MWLDIQQFAHLLTNRLIIIYQSLPMALCKERAQVVLVILKERGITIGCLQSLPMQMTPVAMIRNPDITYRITCIMHHRYRQGLNTLRRSYQAAITIGLLLESLL